MNILPPVRPVMIAAAFAALTGCADLQRLNRATWIEGPIAARSESADAFAAKAGFWYPLRDIATLEPLFRAWGPNRAWNLDQQGQVADSAFYTNRPANPRDSETLDPLRWTGPAPESPWTIISSKERGATRGFVGRDASGRTFLVKLDHPDYAELGTSAEVIGSRIMWLLGYRVPPSFVVTVSGTGDARFDGQRASASPFIEGEVLGHFPFDWLRHRREFRAALLACAWINDVDRAANNGLVVLREGRSYFHLIDFNSSLGSWNGVPKEPWQGRRTRGNVAWSCFRGVFAGLNEDGHDANQRVVSAAVGRFDGEFDPQTWRANLPNTAFDHLTSEDAAWMAQKMAAIPDSVLRAVVESARYSDTGDAEYVLEILVRRRTRILSVWLPEP